MLRTYMYVVNVREPLYGSGGVLQH